MMKPMRFERTSVLDGKTKEVFVIDCEGNFTIWEDTSYFYITEGEDSEFDEICFLLDEPEKLRQYIDDMLTQRERALMSALSE